MAALDLLASAPHRLRPIDRVFIDASQSLANQEREAERRRVRRLRSLNVSVSVALVIALIAGAVAFVQRGEAISASIEAEQATEAARAASAEAVAAEAVADDARAEAELAALISRSEALVDRQPDLAILLALEAHRRAPGAATERAVLQAVSAAPGRVTSFDLPEQNTSPCPSFDTTLVISSDGATGFLELDGRMMSIDLTSGEVTDRGPAPAPCVRWIGSEEQDVRWVTQPTPNSTRTWTGSWDGPLREISIERAQDFLDGSLVGDRILFTTRPFEVLLVDASTGEVVSRVDSTVGSSLVGPYYARVGGDVWVVGDEGRRVVLGLEPDNASSPSQLVTMDGRTGAVQHRIVLDQLPTTISIHGETALVGGLFGSLAAIDLESGEVLSEVGTTSSAAIFATGLREDGMAVAVAEDRIDVVDLQTGRVASTFRTDVGSGTDLGTALVRPDGVVVATDADQQRLSLIQTRDTGLAERAIEVPPEAVVGFGTRRAAVVLDTGEVGVIGLDNDAVSVVDTRGSAPDFGPIAAFPTEDGFVAFGQKARIGLWQGTDLVQQDRLQIGDGVDGEFTPAAFVSAGLAPGPTHARNGVVVALPYSANWLPEVYLVDWSEGVLDTRLIETSFQALTAVSSGDGGVHVMSSVGRIRTYDENGRWKNEMTTGLRYPFVMARSDAGLIAAGGIDGAVIVDPSSGEARTIRDIGSVSALAFADGGRVVVTVEEDGTVRLWDAASATSIGMLARGSGRSPASMPWWDSERRTVWVASSGRIMEFSLDPDRWIERACAFVGRDLTREEWDRLVPGDEPLQSACR